jgi:hypothetical protein
MLHPARVGEAELTIRSVTRDETELNDVLSMGTPVRGYTEPRAYAQLLINGRMFMSDTDHEWGTGPLAVLLYAGAFYRVNGRPARVLIGGLGLGFVVHALAVNQEEAPIERVHVIEKSQDVIDLILPTLPTSVLVEVSRGDVFDGPPRGAKYDLIFFDVWPGISYDIVRDHRTLYKLWRKALSYAPRSKIWSWMADTLKQHHGR